MDRSIKDWALCVLYHNYKEDQILKSKKAKALQHWLDNAKLNLFASTRIKEHFRIFRHSIPNDDIPLILLHSHTFTTGALPERKDGTYKFIVLAALDVFRKAQIFD